MPITFSRNRLSGRAFLFVYLSSIALFNLILGVQGFDMCDEGWVLSGFQQMFNDPESVRYLFLYYLSEYAGALWNSLFGCFGIVAFRVLTALCVTATSLIVYVMLRPYVNRWCILAGMFWTFLCADYGVMVFYHDYFTALLSTAASYCLLRALLHDDCRWIFAAGAIIGANVFARLPNVSLSLLILTLIPYYIYNKCAGRLMRLAAAAVAGFATGAAAVLLLMTVSGHVDIFRQAIEDGISAASDGESTHNVGVMIRNYAHSYIDIIINAVMTAAVPAAVCLAAGLAGRHKHSRIAAVVIGLTAVAAYTIMLRHTSANTILVYATATLWCVRIVFSRRYAAAYVYLACITLVNMYALPLGSDFGIYNMGEYCIYLSGPLAVGLSWQWCRQRRPRPIVCALPLALCAAVFCAFTTLRGAERIASQCYFDEGARWDKTCLIDNPLATTFTTRRNCEQLNPMLRELNRYVRPGDRLLCFQNIATVHFLTRTRPYLYNPWVWTYDPANMQRRFAEAELRHESLPVVVRDKSMLPRWHEYYPDWNNDKATESYCHKNKKITLINSFLSRHRYKTVWENEVFRILLPPQLQGREARQVILSTGKED